MLSIHPYLQPNAGVMLQAINCYDIFVLILIVDGDGDFLFALTLIKLNHHFYFYQKHGNVITEIGACILHMNIPKATVAHSKHSLNPKTIIFYMHTLSKVSKQH